MEELIERYAAVPAHMRFAALGLLLAAMFAGYYTVVHSEQQARLAELEDTYATLDRDRQQKTAYVSNLAKYETRLAELQKDLDRARAMLPDSADVPQFLAQVGSKGRESGLKIKRFEPLPEEQDDFFAEIAFDMEVRGAYHEIGLFIDSLSRLDRIVNVSDITLGEPKSVNDRIVLDGGFRLKTYRFLRVDERGKKGKRGRRKR